MKIEGLESEIKLYEPWAEYLLENSEIVKGWAENSLVKYLQRRNPNVPGIINKLNPPLERNLKLIKEYWRLLSELSPLHEIYAGSILSPKEISIDHFVPWSYVAHDEFWNLSPTTKSINSSKSNNLPMWDEYFPRLASTQYQAYRLNFEHEELHAKFEKILKEHVNSDSVKQTLYMQSLGERSFSKALEDIIRPVWESAKKCGFREWRCR